MSRLRRSNCAAPGIARRRRGGGFEYRDPAGERIDDPEVLERISELAIPPAWREVWICMDPRGHLQATGVDAARRKQYLYHERWRVHRDRLKFDSMLAFGQALPRLRRRVARDLARNRGAEAQLESRDLTMLREHVTISEHELIFDFPAKSGQRRVQEIADKDAQAIVAVLKRRRSDSQLLVYRTADGWSELHADDVNAYIKQHTGGAFTAKDFRTWNATVLAAVALAASDGHGPSRAARERTVSKTIKTVAAYLGNTPAVCRASYVDPRVIDRYHAGVTIAEALGDIPSGGPDLADVRVRRRIEAAVLDLLGVEPEDVVHPVLLGGWWCQSPSTKEKPDEAAR